jgi:hypothetical protein
MIIKTTLKTFLMLKYARVVNVMNQIANLDAILTRSTPNTLESLIIVKKYVRHRMQGPA